jgi:hypothetical protein
VLLLCCVAIVWCVVPSADFLFLGFYYIVTIKMGVNLFCCEKCRDCINTPLAKQYEYYVDSENDGDTDDEDDENYFNICYDCYNDDGNIKHYIDSDFLKKYNVCYKYAIDRDFIKYYGLHCVTESYLMKPRILRLYGELKKKKEIIKKLQDDATKLQEEFSEIYWSHISA